MKTVNVTEFKAKCLDLLDQVGSRQIEQLGITKHGRIVAVLVPPAISEDAVQQLHGFLRSSVVVPEGMNLTAPVLDEPLDAEGGSLHA